MTKAPSSPSSVSPVDRTCALKTSGSIESGAESSNDSAVSTRFTSSDINSSSSSSTPTPIDNVSLSSHSSEANGDKDCELDERCDCNGGECSEAAAAAAANKVTEAPDTAVAAGKLKQPAVVSSAGGNQAPINGQWPHKLASRRPGDNRIALSSANHARLKRCEPPPSPQQQQQHHQLVAPYEQPQLYYEDFSFHEDVQDHNPHHNDHQHQQQQIAQAMNYNPQRQPQNVVTFHANNQITTAAMGALFGPSSFAPEHQYGGHPTGNYCSFAPALTYANSAVSPTNQQQPQAPCLPSQPAIYTATRSQIYHQQPAATYISHHLAANQAHVRHSSQAGELTTFYGPSQTMGALQPVSGYPLAALPPVYYTGGPFAYGQFGSSQPQQLVLAGCSGDESEAIDNGYTDKANDDCDENEDESCANLEGAPSGEDDHVDSGNDTGASCGSSSSPASKSNHISTTINNNNADQCNLNDERKRASYQDESCADEAVAKLAGDNKVTLDPEGSGQSVDSRQSDADATAKKLQPQPAPNSPLILPEPSSGPRTPVADNLMLSERQQNQSRQHQTNNGQRQRGDTVTLASKIGTNNTSDKSGTDNRDTSSTQRLSCDNAGTGSQQGRSPSSGAAMDMRSRRRGVNEQIDSKTINDGRKSYHNRSNIYYHYGSKYEHQQRQIVTAQVPLAAAHQGRLAHHYVAPAVINSQQQQRQPDHGQPIYAPPPATTQQIAQVFLLPSDGGQMLSAQSSSMALVAAPTHPFYFPVVTGAYEPAQHLPGPAAVVHYNAYNGQMSSGGLPNAHKLNQPPPMCNYRCQPLTHIPNHDQPVLPYYFPSNSPQTAYRSQANFNLAQQQHSQPITSLSLPQNFYHSMDPLQSSMMYGGPFVVLDSAAQQHQSQFVTTNCTIPQSIGSQLLNNGSQLPTFAAKLSSRCATNMDYLSSLPIESQPTKTRQAYGMDKVWQDEFERLFDQLPLQTTWTLIEVESNPMIKESKCIIGYKGRYLISVDGSRVSQLRSSSEEIDAGRCSEDSSSAEVTSDIRNDSTNSDDEVFRQPEHEQSSICAMTDANETDSKKQTDEEDNVSDCDSGALVDSTTSSGSDTNCNDPLTNNETESISTGGESPSVKEASYNELQAGRTSGSERSRVPTKFRMFIDSAKVRFCCDSCGHGWTSMKGRVVFWYELFEVIDRADDSCGGTGHFIGYCAYKLFGQQCDVCKVENRFERPMWYPEEVTKALSNLYNKIGQVYFGFKMPAIDKQRRAGKPKTSHNSSLCQACHDGVCTDRK